MEKNKIIGMLTILCLLLSAVVFVSCDDKEDNSSGQVELLSFGPAGVKHGDEITFIGKNLDKVTAIIFAPGVEIPSSSFASATKDVIKLTVPDAVEPGKVLLRTPAGDIESKTVFSLEVAVTVTSVTEEARPGADITITGDKINWIESIVFAKDILVERESFVSQSQTELVVTVPLEAQTGFLVFNTGGTEPLTFDSEEPLTVTLPVGTAATPAIRHAENLTITGTDLDLVTQIDFPGGASVPAGAFVHHSETEIVVTVPTAATNGKLVMTVLSGLEVETTNALSIILPNVTAFSPSDTDDHSPGVTLTITGTDLDLVKALTFPLVAAPVETFLSHTSTEIQVVIPDGAKGGTLVMTTIHDIVVPVSVPFGDQLTLAKVIFDDVIHAPLGAGGGWGGVVTDAASTENPRVGSVSVKVTFAGSWGGGAQFGNWNGEVVSTAGASFYAFSIYGGVGTDGKKLNVNVAGKVVETIVKEGEWKDVQIPMADLNSPAGINEIWFQDQGWSGVVFIDHIGLK